MRKACITLLLCVAASFASGSAIAQTLAKIPPDSPLYGVYPIAYREIITRLLEERFYDAGSAKVEWSEPRAGEMNTPNGRLAGYMVEFKVNARNKFGMYTGFQKYQVLLKNGEIIYAKRVTGK